MSGLILSRKHGSEVVVEAFCNVLFRVQWLLLRQQSQHLAHGPTVNVLLIIVGYCTKTDGSQCQMVSA